MRASFLIATILMACGKTPAPVAAASAEQPACGQASDETVKVMQGLAPHCEGCHRSGPRGYFASANAFQNLLVANQKLVLPGDPEGSQLVRLLEGRGTGAFTQMPIGTKSYAALVADGVATLKIDAIKVWVRNLGVQARDVRPDWAAPRVTRVSPLQIQRALYQQLGLTHENFYIDANEYGIAMAEPKDEGMYPLQTIEAIPAPRRREQRDRAQGFGAGDAYAQQRTDFSVSSSFVLNLTQLSQRWCRLALASQTNQALFPSGSMRAADEANVKQTIARWFVHFHGSRPAMAERDELYETVWRPVFAEAGAEHAWVALCSAFVRHPDWVFY